MDIIKAIEQEQLKKDVPDFSIGDYVRVNVKVKEVRTLIVKPKPKRFGFRSSGYKKAWKKAIVKVESEKPINIAELV